MSRALARHVTCPGPARAASPREQQAASYMSDPAAPRHAVCCTPRAPPRHVTAHSTPRHAHGRP
eukprot:5115602-Prymnesium_polylepis.1